MFNFCVRARFVRSCRLSTLFNFRFLLCLWVSLCFPFSAPAQEEKKSAPDTREPAIMQEVVVTASRHSEASSRVPANVTVIGPAEIKKSTAQNIPELLRAQEGVQVTDITGNHRSYSVDLRGFGDTAPQNTLVLVDGRRVTQSDLSGTDWTLIPLDRVERIEVVRGGSSSIFYGDNASGGVINIITKKGDKTAYGADVRGGSYDTLRAGAYAQGKEKRLSYALSGSYLTSNGYRLNSGTNARDAGASLGYDLSDSTRLSFSTGWHKDDTGLPGGLKESDFTAGLSRKDSTHPNDFANTQDYYLQGGTETLFGGGHLFKVDGSYRKRDFATFSSFSGGEFTGDTDLGAVAISPQLILKGETGSIANRIILGMDYNYAKEEIQNDSLFFGSRTIQNFDLRKTNTGWYAQDELTLFRNLSFSGGYRLDRAVFNFTPGTPGEVVFNEHAFSAGVNYQFPQKGRLYFNYSRSFRYAVFDEMFSFFTNTVRALEPQTSHDYEIGGKIDITPRLRAGINLFRVNTSNEIFFNPFTFNNENLDGKTVRDGIEASVNWQATDRLALFATYSWLARAEVDGGQFNGKWIPGIPRHKATAGGTLVITKPLSLNLVGIFVGPRPFSGDLQNSFSDQDSYAVLNAKLQYRWPIFRAYLDVNNITNQHYSEFGVLSSSPTVEKAYYPSPGINFLVGLAADF